MTYSGGSECKLQMVRIGCLHPRKLPKTLRNGFDLEAKLLGVSRAHWATPLFTQIFRIYTKNSNSLYEGLLLTFGCSKEPV